MKPIQSRRLALFLLVVFTAALDPACNSKKADSTVHWLFLENPKSLDPAQAMDALAGYAINSTYETFLQYHYLKRPYEVTTLLAQSLPKYSPDGLTVTIKLKPGIRFQDDPCFPDGKGRELATSDFVYGWKRLADPKNKSDGWYIFEEKVKGLDEWREEAAKTGQADYSKDIEGLKTPDAHTLVIKLKKKYPQLNYALTLVAAAPMAHEAIEKYGDDIGNHPVGTGPFIFKDYVRGQHIVLGKNPNFHGEIFPMPDPGTVAQDPANCLSKKFTATCTTETQNVSSSSGEPLLPFDMDYGKALPRAEEIEIEIFKESQPGWLKFISGSVDWTAIPKDNFSTALQGTELAPDLKAKGIALSKDPSTTEWFIGFNMDDPVVGGTKNKPLRKAMALAYDAKKDLEIFHGGIGTLANQLLPPLIQGFDAKVPPRETNLQKAKQLLQEAGYPDGKNLPVLHYDLEGSSFYRQLGEFFKAQMAQIGIKVEVRLHTRPELFDMRKKAKTQIYWDGWIADFPDAQNFMQLLYGKNKPPGPNNASFDNPEFNQLYEKMADMTPSPARQKIIKRMNEIIADETPIIFDWYSTIYHVTSGWIKNYKYSDFSYGDFKYYRVDLDKKKILLNSYR